LLSCASTIRILFIFGQIVFPVILILPNNKIYYLLQPWYLLLIICQLMCKIKLYTGQRHSTADPTLLYVNFLWQVISSISGSLQWYLSQTSIQKISTTAERCCLSPNCFSPCLCHVTGVRRSRPL